MKFRVPRPDEFEEIVRKYYREWGLGECIYDICVENLRKIDLRGLTEDDVKRIVRVFLIVWGQMSRVLGRKKKKGWEKRLANAIRSLADVLERFRCIDLAEMTDEKFDKLIADIKSCYSDIMGVVGPTATSKTLHIIAPRFFPMWDIKIRKLYEVSDREGGYVRFMQKLRDQWFKNNLLTESLEKLEKELKRSKLKIIDMYNWVLAKERVDH